MTVAILERFQAGYAHPNVPSNGLTVTDIFCRVNEEENHRMLNTFGGYDWGDPIRLWTVKPPAQFSPAQLAVAERWFDGRWAA